MALTASYYLPPHTNIKDISNIGDRIGRIGKYKHTPISRRCSQADTNIDRSVPTAAEPTNTFANFAQSKSIIYNFHCIINYHHDQKQSIATFSEKSPSAFKFEY